MENQKRASVAITGDFSAGEVIRIATVVMTGQLYLTTEDSNRLFHGKIVIELAEVVESDETLLTPAAES